MKKYTLLLAIFFLFTQCDNNPRKLVNLNEVSKNKIDTLIFDLDENLIADKIKIEIKGQLDDTARLGQYYILPGVVDTTFKQDWYSNEFIIDYYAYKAKKGKLEVDVFLIAY